MLGLGKRKDIVLRDKSGKEIARIIKCPGGTDFTDRIGIEANKDIAITRESNSLALAV